MSQEFLPPDPRSSLPPDSPPPGAPFQPYAAWPPPPPPAPRGRAFGLTRSGAIVATVAALIGGSAVGGFLITRATTATPTAAAASTTASTSTTPTPEPAGGGDHGGFPALPEMGGANLLQEAATYLGISEQTLMTDLQGGKSLADVAATISGKSASGLITSLVSAETTAIDNLVSSGKITASQAATLEANLTSMITRFVNGTHPFTGRGARLPEAGAGAALQAAASAIGITPSQLASDLAGGQTVAAVAGAHSVSTSTVESAVIAAVDKQIAALQSSGRLTATQASQLTSAVPGRVDTWATTAYPGWPFGPFGGGAHPGQ
jgi:hypothetical protein